MEIHSREATGGHMEAVGRDEAVLEFPSVFDADHAHAFAVAVDRGRLSDACKRAFDVVVALLVCIVASPLILAVAAALYLGGGPILFRHERIGMGDRRFKCLKFRTMAVDAEEILRKHLAEDQHASHEWQMYRKLKNDPRVTRVGQFLRKSSLDEIPQLFNVLAGDMSLVGPRPIVEAERDRYGKHIDDYIAVRPGITGKWQVSGRSDLSFEKRVAMDRSYVRHRSFAGDLAILILTIPAVLKSRGSY